MRFVKRRHRIHRKPRSKFSWLKNINIFKYLSILIICVFIFLIPTIIKKLIKIDKIECSSQYGQCPDHIISNFQFSVPNQLTISNSQIRRKLDQEVQVSSYIIQYKIPSTLKIDLVLKKSKYAIKDSTNTYFLIDKNGLIIESTKETPLPFMQSSRNNFKIGDNISNKEYFALKIIEKVALITTIQSSVLEDNELKITTQENRLIRFPLEGDIDVLVGSLRLIFSRLNEVAQGIKIVREIDLRFANPVLR